jgi:hypothetical protein
MKEKYVRGFFAKSPKKEMVDENLENIFPVSQLLFSTSPLLFLRLVSLSFVSLSFSV